MINVQRNFTPAPIGAPFARRCTPRPRRCERVPLAAEVFLRRAGQPNYAVVIHDLSIHGCKLDFVQRPRLHDRIWIRLGGIEPIEADVCWVDGFVGGVEFHRPLHPAVFDLLLRRMS